MDFDLFDIDGFLRNHWQKKPLLIRNPWKFWTNPLEGDDLAGLACEDDVGSRLIMRKHDALKVEHGPFAESRFGKLGRKPWTLLVQAVDTKVPAVAALIDPFRFIPSWRIDDVMVSYATDGGGVGPHFDQYDVFLIQGLGERRWQIGALCDATTPLLPHDDLRLLAEFEAIDEWVLDPGDILYLPPRVAHNGIAVGNDCMTYSIGFRAPSRTELIAHWCDHLLSQLHEDDRYADPDLQAPDNPGEIPPDAVARLHAMVSEKVSDRAAFARWFGEYSSTPKSHDAPGDPDAKIRVGTLRLSLANGAQLARNSASRFSFLRERSDTIWLFADGARFECTEETIAFAERLCAPGRIAIDPNLVNSKAAMKLIVELFNQGSVTLDPEA